MGRKGKQKKDMNRRKANNKGNNV